MVAGIGSATFPSPWNAGPLATRAAGKSEPASEERSEAGQSRGSERRAETAGTTRVAAEGGRSGDKGRGSEDAAPAAGAGRESTTPEDEQEIAKLRSRDAEVRAHEASHIAAGGGHIRGGASYSYQKGPDGKLYAVGGEVGIDVSAVPDNPQATIQKMQQVRAAALAPANPSGADRSVAAAAGQVETRARQQLAERAVRHYASADGAPAAGRCRQDGPISGRALNALA